MPVFEGNAGIKLAYIFGSRVSGEVGPLSDYDFALYLNPKFDKIKMFDVRIETMIEIGRILKTDKVDVVILNTAEAPELKYNIIKDGELIYEKKPFKVLAEPLILNQYFDFRLQLEKNGLIKTRI